MKLSFLGTSRYRLVDLRTGQVVIVFQAYARVSPIESCRIACKEVGIVPSTGPYRLDCMLRSVATGKLRWGRRQSFVLENECGEC